MTGASVNGDYNNKPTVKKVKYYFDSDLCVPLIARKQIGLSSKWEMEWPDGNTSVVDMFLSTIRRIKEDEYKQKVSDFLSHEELVSDAYNDAKERERNVI